MFDFATFYANLRGLVDAARSKDYWATFQKFSALLAQIAALPKPDRPLMLATAAECPYSDAETYCNYLEEQAAAFQGMHADSSGAIPWGQIIALLPALLDVFKLIFGK